MGRGVASQSDRPGHQALSLARPGEAQVTSCRKALTEDRHRVTWREWGSGVEDGRGRCARATNVVGNVNPNVYLYV